MIIDQTTNDPNKLGFGGYHMKQILKNRLDVIFIFGIIILYIAFLGLDIFLAPRSLLSRSFKYASIVLCFLLSTSLFFNSENKRDSKYVVIALMFTMIADIFLLFTHHKVIGIFFFCLVQLTYLKRYHLQIFITGIYFVVISMIAYLVLPLQLLYIIAGLYAILILSCMISTFKTELPKFNLYCVRIGMILFILCDINVALFNELSRNFSYYRFISIAIWLFYLPSQLLLALSASHTRVDNI